MTAVAFIGLGRMGGPMAIRLIEDGTPTAIFDVSHSAYEQFTNKDVRIATSPADAGSEADVACIVVFDDAQTMEVVTAADGLLASMKPGSIIAVHSTVSLETIHVLARACTERGVELVDAGISGGEPGATAGTLLTMVGGSDSAVERVRSTFMSFSKEVIHAGDLGSGLALKLARNATGYSFMAAIHEAMTLSVASGISLDVLKHTIAETGVFEQAVSPFLLGGPEPLPDTAPPQLREMLLHLAQLGEKDLDQALRLATQLDANLPVIQATRTSFHNVARLPSTNSKDVPS